MGYPVNSRLGRPTWGAIEIHGDLKAIETYLGAVVIFVEIEGYL